MSMASVEVAIVCGKFVHVSAAVTHKISKRAKSAALDDACRVIVVVAIRHPVGENDAAHSGISNVKSGGVVSVGGVDDAVSSVDVAAISVCGASPASTTSSDGLGFS